MPLPEVPGLLPVEDLRRTADSIAEVQLPDGMIPWFPGGHADPWNHVEAAMALAVTGNLDEAEAAYWWLADHQQDSGAWYAYYVDGGVEDPKFDANVIAYVATGAWHHWLLTRNRGFLKSLWPVVEKALDYVLDLQTPRGHTLALRPAHRIVERVPQPPVRNRRCRGTRPRAPRLGALAGAPRPGHPDATRGRLRPEGPVGDGLVLPGALRRRHG